MQHAFSYEVCKWNSAMYPGPYALRPPPADPPRPAEADPGYRRDPAWICTSCSCAADSTGFWVCRPTTQ